MSAKEKSGRAIVLGASIGGLLAARALSESYAKVTVFDRDELPTTNTDRRGVPQGEHSHGLLARGRQVLEELFPGFAADLAAAGAVPLDIQGDVVWFNDGHRMVREATGLEGLAVSRPALESYVRTRVLALPNVELRPRHEALGLLATDDRARITGVRVLPVGGGEEQHHEADLVVDATGRGNRGPTWLAELGYDKPVEDLVDPKTVYMSRNYKRVPGQGDFAAFLCSPSPQQPYGGVAIAAEGDRWMVTFIAAGGAEAPSGDPDTYHEFAKQFPGQELYELLSVAEPLGPPHRMRLPVSVRRRYEHMKRLPLGFLAVADAVCSFNPAYGQGMTVAAAEAAVLRDCLAEGREDLQRRFFKAAAKVIDVPWDIAVGADLRYDAVVGKRTAKGNFLNAYVGKIHVAAARHAHVGHAFLSVANLMSAPPRLFAPAVLTRVLRPGPTP
ncbi:FAD-binding monooxygenase [Catellatospora sp. TT07R-123]|uniref:FAD-dependent oxidoreductase n=1 Tax=Catellatospora sp. TT07R-123 TaxID=2733863 RepID=UPI001B2941AC|nr:squalene monooxygenase [Catellatospora sp. TT07R-123]GHJ45164.1 FAD-binding monooxygenase [Catellatospora sp. TT07R-123]